MTSLSSFDPVSDQAHAETLAKFQSALVSGRPFFIVVNPIRCLAVGPQDLQEETVRNYAKPVSPDEGLAVDTRYIFEALAPHGVLVSGRDPNKRNGDGASLEDFLTEEIANLWPRVTCNGMVIGYPVDGTVQDKIVGPQMHEAEVLAYEELAQASSMRYLAKNPEKPSVIINKKPHADNVGTICFNGSNLVSDEDWQTVKDKALMMAQVLQSDFTAVEGDKILEFVPDPERFQISRGYGALEVMRNNHVPFDAEIFVIGNDPKLDMPTAGLIKDAGYTNVTNISVGKPYGADAHYASPDEIKEKLLGPALQIAAPADTPAYSGTMKNEPGIR